MFNPDMIQPAGAGDLGNVIYDDCFFLIGLFAGAAAGNFINCH